MNVNFFLQFFNCVYALTMHGLHVSTLTKSGSVDAAMPLKKLKMWHEHKVRKNVSPISALL
jgi:hypothetical protein